MRNLKLVIEFDGSRFHGSQRQAEAKEPTVQGVMEKRLAKLLGVRVPIVFSGRTDAGVHALGQVVNFKLDSTIPTARFPLAYGSLLPPEIGILSCEEAPLDFHARFSARGKTYRYLILLGSSVFWRHRAWQVEREFDVESMRQAAALLSGEHDFSSWRAQGSGQGPAARDLKLTVRPVELAGYRLLAIEAAATGFLYKMVRNLVGTLAAAGEGKLTLSDVEELLLCRDRTLAPPTAPACGLYLVKVDY